MRLAEKFRVLVYMGSLLKRWIVLKVDKKNSEPVNQARLQACDMQSHHTFGGLAIMALRL